MADSRNLVINPRPSWRGRIHTWAFVVSIPAGILLLLSSHRAAARTSVAIYALSLAAVFGTSAAYHRLARSITARRRMRRLDHAMIYVLIAGTYTPLCLLALPRAWGIPLLAVLWTGAAVGITLQLIGVDRFRRISNIMYLVLGWAAIVGLPVMVHRLPSASLTLMLTGGLAYTIGAIVFFLHRPNPAPMVFGFHEIWHAFTVLAGASHFAMIWMVATVH